MGFNGTGMKFKAPTEEKSQLGSTVKSKSNAFQKFESVSPKLSERSDEEDREERKRYNIEDQHFDKVSQSSSPQYTQEDEESRDEKRIK